MSSLTIRPFRSGDEPSLAKICCETGNNGKDGTGLLSDDRLWGDIWVLPYVKRDPQLAWVVEDLDGQVIGYTVGTDDSDAFNQWYKESWWPAESKKYERPPTSSGGPSREQTFFKIADETGSTPLNSSLREYPAHLHIDLLPPAQGKGLGRKMIRTLLQAMQDRGIKGVHLGASAENHSACAFYQKIGFGEVPTQDKGSRIFVWDLTKPLQ
ncbi:N-acetyltransferase GCN5 [Kockovaella imperatae]|uniref:N-acetyltransferase GCN5 n=1 Tax=Kockovaella imperatae TaxID=4999 RepID=A0A1Y1UQH7_9TREE|nr:N-acetyltransferase GCN5 [Kockovaella imperatae]ORX40320.1 N-acetyltransferase GCN5 [Kockovaella imperatae]